MQDDILQEILKKHALWLNGEEGGEKANLISANMRGAYLSDANMSDANLRGADLRGADLRDADLSYVKLSNANLNYADLRGADLSYVKLSNANLNYADLRGADLKGADLRGADLKGANLRGADLRGADLKGANLRGADLKGANLRGADLRGVDLSEADLSGVKGVLSQIEFMEANFDTIDEGYIVYKSFGEFYQAPQGWDVKENSIISEVCNPDRTNDCGCGINAAPLEWVKKNYGNVNRPIWKLLIKWAWLPGVVVPYNTDGKIRCEKAMLLEIVD